MEKLSASCDPEFVGALERAAKNIRNFHERQKQRSWLTTREDGVDVGRAGSRMAKVGLYVPGGSAADPSSVLMNAIPAKIAGVRGAYYGYAGQKRCAKPPISWLAAIIAGVDRVFLVGGAHGVAALAYGTQSVPKVDKIVGPGNIYVATAKKQLYGTVDIDMIRRRQ